MSWVRIKSTKFTEKNYLEFCLKVEISSQKISFSVPKEMSKNEETLYLSPIPKFINKKEKKEKQKEKEGRSNSIRTGLGIRFDLSLLTFDPQRPFWWITLRIFTSIPKSGEMKTQGAALSFDSSDQRVVEIAAGDQWKHESITGWPHWIGRVKTLIIENIFKNEKKIENLNKLCEKYSGVDI